MNIINRVARLILALCLLAGLSGCDDPQVYGSIGVSSGYSSYAGYRGYGRYDTGPRMHGSISVGGRIH